MSVTVFPGFTISAEGATAFSLGFVRGMQYEGLARDEESALPNDNV
jgi:hypothetical protein